MKLTEVLIVVALWLASVLGAFYFGMDYKEASMKAADAVLKEAIQDTRKQAMEGAADAIGKITVRNTTVQGKVETIIKDNPVYRDCQHTPDGLQYINQALTGRTGPTGGGSMPGTVATQ